MFDINKPSRAQLWFAFGLLCIGLAVGEAYYPPTYDVFLFVVVVFFFAAVELLSYEVNYTLWDDSHLREIYGDEPGQIEAEVKPKPIDLNEKDGIWQSVAANVNQRDLRWQQFGQAVCEGQRIVQSKWTGKGRPFSKTEFAPQIKKWFEVDKVLKLINPKARNSGWKPNGPDGWRYFKALADGREWLPLPQVKG